jgi:hypothetical protein
VPNVIYILTNAAMPGLIKIGRTEGDVADRIKQLDTTSLPLPFECFYAAEVADVNKVESAIHHAFGDHRIRKNRVSSFPPTSRKLSSNCSRQRT